MARFKIPFLRALSLAVLTVLTVSSTLSAQTLAWNANTESNLAGYRVQYGTVSGSPSTTIDVGRVTSRPFTGLQPGVTYYFRVVAYNTAGQTSAPSTQASFTVPGTPATPSPTLTSVAPATGPTAGGTTITLTGTNFVSGAMVRVGGVAANGVTFASNTRITARTPAGTAGGRDVVVTNPDGRAATRAGAFTYIGTASAPLTAAAVSPSSGPTAGGTSITVTGTGFVSGAAILIGGTPATAVSFVSSTSLTARTPAKPAGGYSVQVRNPNGQTANTPRGFLYSGTSTPPPPTGALTAAAVTPDTGPTSGGTAITVTGTGFVSGATVLIGGTPATSVSVASATRITARTPAKPAGGYSVQVRNPNGQTANAPRGFLYSGTSTPPPTGALTAAAVTPNTGPTSGGTAITVTGTGFVSGATVLIGGTPATSVSVASATRITARTPAKPAGGYSVQVRNPNGQTANTPRGFLYPSATSSETTAAARTLATPDDADAVDAANLEAAADPLFAEDGALASSDRAADDSDGDGLPTDWETRFGLNPASAAGDDGAAGDPDGDGVPNDAEHAAGSHPRGLFRRYLAEGIESQGMHTRLAIANAEEGEARVLLTFMDADGATTRRPVDVPARSRRTIDLSSVAELTGTSFSTVLESDRVVALDRLVSLDPAGRATTLATAIDEPSATWHFGEASTVDPVEQFYLVQNPGETDARVQIRYLLADGAAPVVRDYTVAAHSRATIWVDREEAALAAAMVAAEVTSLDGVPIVVERTLYETEAGSPMPRSGDTQAGETSPDALGDRGMRSRGRWLLAEGQLGGAGATTTMLEVLNRGAATDVTVTLLFEDGPEAAATFPVQAGARLALPLVRAFPAASGRRFSVLVEGADGAADLLVERAIAGPADRTRPPTVPRR
ncbi:MAG TPA: IPT/TIG domain-containing protein [Vicinamibacterales bacterium]|nr:IPT/TIG domain-containing protein [Vicinamibacterales bacterium]